MQRPAAHVVDNGDAAELVQHVAVNAVEHSIQSVGLVVIDGFVKSVIAVCVDSIVVKLVEYRQIERERNYAAVERYVEARQRQIVMRRRARPEPLHGINSVVGMS